MWEWWHLSKVIWGCILTFHGIKFHINIVDLDCDEILKHLDDKDSFQVTMENVGVIFSFDIILVMIAVVQLDIVM